MPRANDVAGRQLAHRARIALGHFLDDRAWDHFCTLTFARARSPEGAAYAFVHEFIPRLHRLACREVVWVYSCERSPAGLWHLHAFVANTGGIPDAAMRAAWRLGHSDVEPYRHGGGAAHYILKGVPAEFTDWAFNNLPPVRGAGRKRLRRRPKRAGSPQPTP